MNNTFTSDAGIVIRLPINSVKVLKKYYDRNDMSETFLSYQEFLAYHFKSQEEVDVFDMVFGEGFQESNNPSSRKPSLVDVYLHHQHITRL